MRYKFRDKKLYYYSEDYDRWMPVPYKGKEEPKSEKKEEDTTSEDYDRAMQGI